MDKSTQERQLSSADRLRLEILASMQTATDVQASDRCLLSADDATDDDNSDNDDDQDQLLLTEQSGAGLQIKTSGVRKGKCKQVAQPISHIGTGKCRALNDRTAQLMRGIMMRFALVKVCEQESIQRAKNYRIYSATTRDEHVSYTIKIYRNAEPQQLKTWAQEERDLHSRIRACGVNVPEPIFCLEHILVTRDVATGTSLGCSVPLKDVTPSRFASYIRDRYVITLWTIRQLYQRAGIVHGNISGHTVLFQNVSFGASVCWLTDLSHVVDRQQSGHEETLARDIARVNARFLELGLERSVKWIGVLPDEVAMAYVTMENISQGFGGYTKRITYVGAYIPMLYMRRGFK